LKENITLVLIQVEGDIEEETKMERNFLKQDLMLKLVEVVTSKTGVNADIVACAVIQKDSEADFKKADVEAMNTEEAETIVKMEKIVNEKVTVETEIGEN